MKKRLAILLAAAMLITSMPFYVFADDTASADGQGQTGVVASETAGDETKEEGTDVEAEDPTDPTDPVDPAEPSDPTDPTEPTDPAEPTDPVDPEEPEEPQIVYPAVIEEDGKLVYYVEEGVADTTDGWKADSEGNLIYYIRNGELLSNIITKVDGKPYYFNKKAELKKTTGWKTASNGKGYVKNGALVTVPTKIKKTFQSIRYYNKKTKKWQKTKISGAKTKYVTVTTNYVYMFKKTGLLYTKKGLFKYNSKEYYGLGNGRLKTGWKAIVEKKKGKAVYFYKNTGAMAKNTKIKYLKIPKSGRLGRAYYLGVKKLDKIGWSLRKAYSWSAHMRYQGRSYRAKNSETYAIKGFTKGYGNCYCMAATFYIMAKLLGYDVHQVEGRVDLPHSWTVIRQDGREWVYDPNFTNETGRNGWKIYYGKKGTWRYNHYHKMN